MLRRVVCIANSVCRSQLSAAIWSANGRSGLGVMQHSKGRENQPCSILKDEKPAPPPARALSFPPPVPTHPSTASSITGITDRCAASWMQRSCVTALMSSLIVDVETIPRNIKWLGRESWQPCPVQGGLAGSLRPWQVIVAAGQTDAIKHV